jgi:hypothetical protein
MRRELKSTMWDLLTEDTLDCIAAVGSVQMLGCLRQLEKRCAAIDRAKARLDNCRLLTMPPFRLHPNVIFGRSKSYFNHNQIGDVGMQAFASAVASGAMAGVTELFLHKNKIGDVGMGAFAKALANGAMAGLIHLDLFGNQIGDVGMTKFAQSIKPVSEGGSGAMAGVTVLRLNDNKIGDVGMEAFARVLADGAMAQCKILRLNNDKIGDVGMKAFAKALADGALEKLQWLFIDSPSKELKGHCSAKSINLNCY